MVKENPESRSGSGFQVSDSFWFEKTFPTLAGMRYPAKKSKSECAKINMSDLMALSLIPS